MIKFAEWLANHRSELWTAVIIYVTVAWILEALVHEFGHWYFQWKYGVRVLFVKIGFGPKLLTVRLKDGTTFILGIPLPFIGQSRSLGEGDDYEAERENPQSLYYARRHPKERLVIAAAGSLMALLATTAVAFVYQGTIAALGVPGDLRVYGVLAIIAGNELLNLVVPFAIPLGSSRRRWQKSDALIMYIGLWEWLRWKEPKT